MKICQSCGKVVDDDSAVLCPYCGKQTEKEKKKARPKKETTPKVKKEKVKKKLSKKSVIAIIFCVVVVFLIAGATGVSLFVKNNKGNPELAAIIPGVQYDWFKPEKYLGKKSKCEYKHYGCEETFQYSVSATTTSAQVKDNCIEIKLYEIYDMSSYGENNQNDDYPLEFKRKLTNEAIVTCTFVSEEQLKYFDDYEQYRMNCDCVKTLGEISYDGVLKIYNLYEEMSENYKGYYCYIDNIEVYATPDGDDYSVGYSAMLDLNFEAFKINDKDAVECFVTEYDGDVSFAPVKMGGDSAALAGEDIIIGYSRKEENK
jgi:flagellar basal body-associated protein FliL